MRKPRTTKTVAAPFDDERSADAVTSLTLMGLLASMLYSFPLWLNSSREYPLLPPLDWWPLLPRPVDLIALLTLVLAAVVRIFSNKLRWLSLLVAVIAVLLALQDQTRWQPWFYQYILMLVFLAAGHKFGNRQGLDACCIIMSFTYLWSGLQKVNAGFCMELVPWLFHLDPKYGIAAGIACALAEATLGIALLLHDRENCMHPLVHHAPNPGRFLVPPQLELCSLALEPRYVRADIQLVLARLAALHQCDAVAREVCDQDCGTAIVRLSAGAQLHRFMGRLSFRLLMLWQHTASKAAVFERTIRKTDAKGQGTG